MTEPEPKTDRARARFAHSQHVAAAPEAIFPLLCPLREFDWIPSWDCELVYTESGLAEPDAVFTTDRERDGGRDVWVISRFEPPSRIAFVRVNRLRTMHYDVHLTGEGDGSTTLTWEQTITALDDEGDRFVASLREEDFARLIETMEQMIEHYLTTGEPLDVAYG